MTSGSILLALALLAGVAFYVAMPLLLPRRRRQQDVKSHRRQALAREKDQLMARLRALEFDWETGKIPDDVYEGQRSQWMARAAEILKELDAADATAPQMKTIDRDIEEAVAQLRSVSVAERPPQVAVPAGNGSPRPAAQFCPSCGQSVLPDDRFCAFCGHNLVA